MTPPALQFPVLLALQDPITSSFCCDIFFRTMQRWVLPERAAGIDFTGKRYYTEIRVGLDCGISVWAHIEPHLGLYFHPDLTAEQQLEAITKIEEYEDSLKAVLGRSEKE